MPIELVEDLLLLDLGILEKSLLVEATRSENSQDLENFLLKGVTQWPQDIGVVAIRQWCAKTQRRKAHQWPGILGTPSLSQRVFYTIIDRCFETGGARVIKAALEAEGLLEMSHAVHGLLLLRATQWQLEHPLLKEMAHRSITDQGSYFGSEHRGTAPAVGYLAWSEPLFLQEIFRSTQCHEAYRPVIGAVLSSLAVTGEGWPLLWQRPGITKAQVLQGLKSCSELYFSSVSPKHLGTTSPKNQQEGPPWEQFAGIPSGQLRDALLELDQPLAATTALSMVHGLLDPSTEGPLRDHLGTLGVFQDPMLSALVPWNFRPEAANPTDEAREPSQGIKKRVDTGMDRDRKLFFDLAYRGFEAGTDHTPSPSLPTAPTFWTDLTHLWLQPSEGLIQDLAIKVRRKGGIYNICYLNTLGRCKGIDQAALKVLDFVRSDQEEELKAAMGALSGIDTPRSLQELIAALTRPNMTRSLQLEALAQLKLHDLSQVQPHLRSAFSDFGVPVDAEGAEVRELLATTLEVPVAVSSTVGGSSRLPPNDGGKGGEGEQGQWDQTFDQTLSGMIQGYRDLSSEVKRSLRTSLFFHRQVDQRGASGMIDLSPVIDMQYKALELLFRESFEDYCSKVINRGNLQRKLDIIGYARPIPANMDQFENYIASLPTISEIQFFSKYKLRKMLRAICLFRPGRRFTLDGVKAFALFFLCFGRKHCTYGLAQLIETGFPDDQKLFEFCNSLHTFQDMRNRAAHEGLHPEAASDLDKLWFKTAEIIQTHNLVYASLKQIGEIKTHRGGDLQDSPPQTPKTPKSPLIIKKVS